MRLIVVTDDLKGVPRVVHHGECVLAAGIVIHRDIGLAGEDLERIEKVEAEIHRRAREAGGDRIGVEVPRLHVECAGGGLEFRAMDPRLEDHCGEIEVDEPGLRLPLLRGFAGEIAADRPVIQRDDARHKARARRQRFVFVSLLAAGERDDLLDREGAQIHHRQGDIDERPFGALARLHVIRLGDDQGLLADDGELRIVRAFHLRGSDVDEARQHPVGGLLGIPVGRQQPRFAGLIDHRLPRRERRCGGGKRSQKDQHEEAGGVVAFRGLHEGVAGDRVS